MATIDTSFADAPPGDIVCACPKPAAAVVKNLPSAEQIGRALGAVPGKQLDSNKEIVVSPNRDPSDAYRATQYNIPGFASAATGGPSGVTFYPKATAWDHAFVDSTAIHEGGHAFFHRLVERPESEEDMGRRDRGRQDATLDVCVKVPPAKTSPNHGAGGLGQQPRPAPENHSVSRAMTPTPHPGEVRMIDMLTKVVTVVPIDSVPEGQRFAYLKEAVEISSGDNANRHRRRVRPLASSAGITAGIHLVLHLIGGDCGDALAAAVAGDRAVYLRRPARDPELSPFLAHRHHLRGTVHQVQDASTPSRNATGTGPGSPRPAMSPSAPAAAVHRPRRRLAAAHLQAIRIERARQSLEHGASVTHAAEVAGFRSGLQPRRAWGCECGGLPRDAVVARSAN